MPDIALVLDCDDTIISTDEQSRTLLERLLVDYYDTLSIPKKISMLYRSRLVKLAGTAARFLSKFFEDNETTGETTSLKACNLFLLKKERIPVEFLEERAAVYAKLIEPKHKEAIMHSKYPIYIVSSEPEQLLEAIIKHAGLKEHISGVYGIRFKIEDNFIIGFEKKYLSAGISGKYKGMREIIRKGHRIVHAIDDSNAGIGLFDEYEYREGSDDSYFVVIPHTFDYAPESLKSYVKKHKGFIHTNLDDFFKKVQAV